MFVLQPDALSALVELEPKLYIQDNGLVWSGPAWHFVIHSKDLQAIIVLQSFQHFSQKVGLDWKGLPGMIQNHLFQRSIVSNAFNERFGIIDTRPLHSQGTNSALRCRCQEFKDLLLDFVLHITKGTIQFYLLVERRILEPAFGMTKAMR
jgi:hypothetical protein